MVAVVFLFLVCFSTGYAIELDLSTFSVQKEQLKCKSGDGEACFNLYVYFHKYKNDDLLALPYLKRSCDLKYGLACIVSALYYKDGYSFKKNPQKALALLRTAIKSPSKRVRKIAYYQLAEIYENGIGVKKNLFKAFSLYKEGCKEGNLSACVKVGDFYKNGWGTKLNFEKALEFYAKACEKENEESCNKYASLKRFLLFRRIQEEK